MWDTKIISPTDVEIIGRSDKGTFRGVLSTRPSIGSFYCPKIDLRKDQPEAHLFISGLDEENTKDFLQFANIELYPLRQTLEFSGEIAAVAKERMTEDIRLTFVDDTYTCVPNNAGLLLDPVSAPVAYTVGESTQDTQSLVVDGRVPDHEDDHYVNL